jgi:ADP-heptose:LPS heptosyltransferase
MKVLVIRFSSIGDIVLTTPVVRCLKQQANTAQVHYLTKVSFRTIIENNPYIDKGHYLDDDWEALMETLRLERFDYIIDLHRNIRTLRVKRALKVKSWSFNKLNIRKWLLTTFKINLLPAEHIVDRYMAAARALGVRNDGKGLDYFIPDKDRIGDHDIPLSHTFGFIGVVIGAALATKKLPVDKLKELCTAIEHPIILLGGKEDKVEGDLIAAIDPIKIYNACGNFNLNESADLVSKARLIISHDTGLMHIAAAFQKPILSIWGNTVPAFGMTPYYGAASGQAGQSGWAIQAAPGAQAAPTAPAAPAAPATLAFEVKPLGCRPCSKIGYDKCPRGHFKCMRQQDIGAIVQAIRTR